VPPAVPTSSRQRIPDRTRAAVTLLGPLIGAGLLATTGTAPAAAATVIIAGAHRTTTENWAAPSTTFHAATGPTRLTIVPTDDTPDGSALQLQLGARPDPGAAGAAVIASNRLYRYGRFATRMKTADCSGQDHPGVVTGAFSYGADTSDANHNGITDNAELDVEFLCAQPEVVYLSVWTDYSETANRLAEITRVINLRTGAVLKNCYITSYNTACRPALSGENSPASVAAVPGFNSATQFHTYTIDWQPDQVRFSLDNDGTGGSTELWNYRGPRSRIPANPSWFIQSVAYTKVWDPLNGPSHNQPTLAVAAIIDSTSTPR
jgi:beta-glucanase (GH16 family)